MLAIPASALPFAAGITLLAAVPMKLRCNNPATNSCMIYVRPNIKVKFAIIGLHNGDDGKVFHLPALKSSGSIFKFCITWGGQLYLEIRSLVGSSCGMNIIEKKK
jgi:hypothetical protein